MKCLSTLMALTLAWSLTACGQVRPTTAVGLRPATSLQARSEEGVRASLTRLLLDLVHLADKNGSGALEPAEREHLHSMLSKPSSGGADWARNLVIPNATGQGIYTAFVQANLTPERLANFRADMKRSFDQVDLNDDGFWTELDTVDHQAQRMALYLLQDSNQDGKLSFSEFEDAAAVELGFLVSVLLARAPENKPL